ncbi:reverse transcriptase domain-containing protein [Tanacetum coccineum]
MFKYRDTENEVVRLMMFPISLTGEAKTWLDELNEGTIETWDELRTAFISRFFPPALFDRLLGEIRAFFQHENETLTDAWLRMKEMLRNCNGHNLSKGNIIKIFYHGLNEITQEAINSAAGGIFLYKTLNQAYQLLKDKVLLKLDWAKNQKTKSSLKKTFAFADEGSSNSDTDKFMTRMDAMTMKMDAQYKEMQSHSNHSIPEYDEDNKPMSPEAEAKFMQTFRRTRFYNDYRDRDSNRDNWRSSGRNDYNQDNYQSNSDDKIYDLQRQLSEFIKAQHSTNSFVMEEMYGYQEGVQQNNYQRRRMFGSGSNIQATSSNDNNHKQQKNNELAEELEDDLLRETRAKILSHPLYPKLLQVYIDCQKVGAPTNIANLFDEIFKDNDFCRRSSSCSCLGDDPELDEFMETYCEMLDKYRSDLARPYDEATTFLNNMQTQLTNLCKGTTINYYNTAGIRARFMIQMSPKRSEGEESEYPFFDGDD